MPPVSAALGRTDARKCSIGGFMLAVGLNILKIYFYHNMNTICKLCKLIINIFPQIPTIGS